MEYGKYSRLPNGDYVDFLKSKFNSLLELYYYFPVRAHVVSIPMPTGHPKFSFNPYSFVLHDKQDYILDVQYT